METYSNSYGLLLVFFGPIWSVLEALGSFYLFLSFFSIKGIPIFMIGFT